MKLFWFLHPKKKYVLVISWWGTRWFYALWILKWLEEFGYKEKIQAIYGVSAGAIVGSYRAAGYTAQQIYDMYFNVRPFWLLSLNLLSMKSILKVDYFKKQFTKDLPKDISQLKIKTYIWTTDAKTGKYILFDKGELTPILLWSMSIPGVFPIVNYKMHSLIDGGTANNFPVNLAKKKYPKSKIIGIALNKFREKQNMNTLIDALSVSFEILLRHNTIEHMHLVDHLFYKDLPIKVLDTSKKRMHEAYVQGYKDCIQHFK